MCVIIGRNVRLADAESRTDSDVDTPAINGNLRTEFASNARVPSVPTLRRRGAQPLAEALE
jgi:hypothetical protein